LHFKRLELHGFKSFAEPVIFDFTEGMTCVVGPNGSGKSNIADAIKWVLGEQSAKNLRGGKMEEVIFAGTANRKPRGIAEVTLVIDNEDQSLPIDYSEVAITRKMYRSGESEYAINRRPCRMKDIKELIMDTGIGVEGYSLISQGRISEIVNNKAEGRRELFEEAAGIVKYRTRKREAQRKLNAASANLDRVNDIISEIDGRIDGLKEDSEKATEYLSLRDKYRHLEINLAVRQAESLDNKIADLNEEIKVREKEAAELEKELKNNAERLEKAKAEEAVLSVEGDETATKRMSLLEKISEHKNDIEVSGEKLTAFERERTRLEGEILRLKREIMQEEAAIEDYNDRWKKLEIKKVEIAEQIKNQEAVYSKSSDSLQKKKDLIEEKRSAVFSLHSGINVGKTEISGLESLIDGLDRRKIKLTEDSDESEKIISTINSQLESLKSEADSLEASKSKLEEEQDSAKSEVEESELQKEKVTTNKGEIEINLHRAKTKLDLLSGFELSYEGFAQAVKFIMSKKNSLKGIRGVVADHIDVPAGFETAIQTALSGSMQNIVCEDDKSASAAVELLKKERAGRATFLPIKGIKSGKDAAESQDSERIKNEPGFRGFGTEVVGYDEELRGIVTYLLGKTVIADNLESAIKMSSKYRDGLRFVTIEGELVNPAGAISGGRFKKENTNVFRRKNEIKALEEMIGEYNDELDDLEKMEEAAGHRVEAAKFNLTKASKAVGEATERLISLQTEIEKSEERRSAIQENVDRWQAELREIDNETTEAQSMIDKIRADVGAKQEEINLSEDAVDEELKALEEDRQSSEGLLELISGLRLSAHTVESDLKHLASSEQSSRFTIAKLNGEIEEKLKEKEMAANSEAETVAHIEALSALLEKAEAENKNLAQKTWEIKSKKEEVSSLRNECEELNMQFSERLNTAKAAVYDIQVKLARSETQAESVKNSLWDTFEVTFPEAQAMKTEPFTVSTASRESREIKNRMRELEPVNIGAIDEYKQVSERLSFLTEQRSDLIEATDSLMDIIKDMDRIITTRFLDSFEEIGGQFKRTFAELFGGGAAELKLENYDDVLESTIEIVAQPPGKKLQNINLLSGGEKSLTAIALLCAILRVRPTPFCILDEVEAALDEANIERFVDYIRAMDNIQFIVVTHQKTTMEKADALYGITMPEKGVSKVVSLRMEQ